MLRIDIKSLTPGVHSETLSPSPDDIGVEDDKFDDIEVQVHLDFDGSELLVHLDASAVATLECDRTLKKFEQPISGTYSVLYTPPEAIDEDEADEAVVPLDFTDDTIEITDFVRDTLLLAIPVKKIAPGAEEADIPTAFGEPTEEEVDPRWEKLKKLKGE